MNLSVVEKIAEAVLYEGYILYPYRASSVKNQQRWNFGAVCPESYSLAQRGTESWTMQTECLVQMRPGTELGVKVRFLHLLTREVGVPNVDGGVRQENGSLSAGRAQLSRSDFSVVPSLEVNGQRFQTWQEAIERQVTVTAINLDEPATEQMKFSFPASESIELLRADNSHESIGALIRRQEAIEGTIDVSVMDSGVTGLRKITIRILNQTPLENADQRSRDEALMRSFVSTHTILSLNEGDFVSLLDPPETFREAAAGCSNIGTYPVLAGEDGSHDCMLSSPIILYDYPQIAPESPGSLFDGTEIDEILTLRIMTLTEEEKREMRGGDDRARQILERTETMPVEQFMKMHGAMKGVNRKP